jgi:endonuclease-3
MKHLTLKIGKRKPLVVKDAAKVRLARPGKRAGGNRATKPLRRMTRAELGPYSQEVFSRLKAAHPDAHCELDHETPLQLLVATILSAQCTDKRVNMVTPLLFSTYPTAADLADAPPEKLEEIIKSTGFFRNKTKSLIALGKALVERHDGEVPDTMEALVKLPGVGRKTANVILGNAFRKNEGVVVDTHVGRLSARLGLSKQKDPVKIEEDLMPLFPRDDWAMLAHVLIFHGRRVCDARAPKCDICSLNEICPSSTVSIYRERK